MFIGIYNLYVLPIDTAFTKQILTFMVRESQARQMSEMSGTSYDPGRFNSTAVVLMPGGPSTDASAVTEPTRKVRRQDWVLFLYAKAIKHFHL